MTVGEFDSKGPKLPSVHLLAQHSACKEDQEPHLLPGVEGASLAPGGEALVARGVALVRRARAPSVARRQRPHKEDARYEHVERGGEAQGQRIEEREVQKVDGQVERDTR